ncbi:accessory gene regulator B family protein [Clostridium sp. BNL1100]|uniref:accessory gene regulator ArgB-like protein n=1 Tax=Clostridium sp. BNL1100 TaxID=755731 RepID=UPI00024A7DC0|nr:accessory gene regulator B family protein [Clostridium sp. BNL1100]AEY65381.1 protein possibly involved in post-translational modification of quorum-sensing peptides [Clostridium sp. BNL1100]
MKIVQKMSFSSANFLVSHLQENHQKRTEYYFGFQMIFQSILKVFLLLIFALLFDTLQSVVFIILSFTTLRFTAGGTHMGTYFKCFLITILTFLPLSILCRYFSYLVYGQSGYAIGIFIFTISAISIFCYAPQNSPLNQLTLKRKKTLKIFSLIILLFWFGFSIKLHIESVLSIYTGILLEISSITPIGDSFYKKINSIGGGNK